MHENCQNWIQSGTFEPSAYIIPGRDKLLFSREGIRTNLRTKNEGIVFRGWWEGKLK